MAVKDGMQQRTVWFSGDVQGVGFRATTQRLAANLAVAGEVRNLSDGRVEALLEGTPAEIDRLLDDLRQHFGPQISDLQSDIKPATGAFTDFVIRR